MNGNDTDFEATDPSRRKFLIRGVAAIGGGIFAAIGVPAAIFVTGSARTAVGGGDWYRLGSVSSVEVGGSPMLMKAKVERRNGYLVEESEIACFVATKNGSDFAVMSNICTHLGCRVRWIEGDRQFLSPCHNGIFDEDGNVVSGPPPRPLDRYEYKVEDGQIFIREG